MKVLSKEIENREATLIIEIDSVEVEDSLKVSYKKIVKETAVPGFRKGKAPRSVLEQHIGKDALLEDALNSLIPEVYTNAIKEQDIEPFDEPSIKITQREPVTFEVKVPLTPIVKIGDYNKIRMKQEKVKIKEEEISKVIEDLRQRNVSYNPVERPIQVNDIVTVDVKCVVGEETIIDKKGTDYHIIMGMAYPAPGFPEKLLKMEKGKENEFKLILPKNYYKKELAEKEAFFKVEILEIKEEVLPEINDDFAKLFGSDIKNMDGLKESIKKDLKSYAEENARIAFEDKLIEELIGKSELEYPAIMVDREINNMVAQYLQQLSRSAMNQSHYEKMLENINKEELQEKYRPMAIKRVGGTLVLDKVAEAEKIEASDIEIDAEIERMTQNAGDKKDEQKQYFSNPQNKGYIKRMVATRKTVEKLVDIAQNSKKKNTKQKETK